MFLNVLPEIAVNPGNRREALKVPNAAPPWNFRGYPLRSQNISKRSPIEYHLTLCPRSGYPRKSQGGSAVTLLVYAPDSRLFPLQICSTQKIGPFFKIS
jgi:hypothetical protein